MLHSRSQIDELQMWQKVKELASSFILTAVQFEVCAYDVRDPTICVAIEMRAHVSENNVWHVWLGFNPSMCESRHVTTPEGVSSDFLGPLRCLCHGRRVWVVPLKYSGSSKIEAQGVWVWK